MLRALIAKGGNADATDAKTVLPRAACAATSPACVAALLDSDADPNAAHEGVTSLMWCVGLRGRRRLRIRPLVPLTPEPRRGPPRRPGLVR